ncbi:FKBP-type peptidyl-prolyl cis-trans isomerase N-terminal domain-containing protein [Klebsiella aerogenes]|uniref:FKBP-type peptidyl-prolyl cis-trans isomerase N-terminal domain-containing protein n=1 Tax=Klebsiella aerogenes TaxID=548 RepID=UPI001F274F22|nr:FKBP-type peptidyl-prolyl cis-trans isomerase N-terminal domain-containing protein [Klebsiella aerogenes]
MQWRRYSTIAFCLTLPWQFSAHAVDRSSEQFLSDISSLSVPSDTITPPTEKKSTQDTSSTSPKKNPHEHRSASTSASIAALQSQISVLKKKNAALEKEVKSQKTSSVSGSAISSLKAENKGYQQQIRSLQTQLKAQRDASTADQPALQKKVTELTARINSTAGQNGAGKSEVTQYQQQITALQKQLKALQNTSAADKVAAEKKIAALNTASADQTASLKTENTKYQQQIKTLQTQLKAIESTSDTNTSALQKKMTALLAQRDTTARENTALKTDNTKYQQQINELQAKLKKQQNTSIAKAAVLQKKISDLVAQGTATTEQSTALKSDNAKYQQQISDLQGKLKKQQDTSTAETAALQKKISDLVAQKTTATGNNTSLKADNVKYQQQISDLQTQLKTLQEVSAADKKKIANLTSQKTTTTGQNTELKTDNAKYQQQISELQAKLKKQQDISTAETAALQKKISDLAAQKTTATGNNTSLKVDNAKYQQQISELQAKLKKQQDTSSAETAALQKKISDLAAQKNTATGNNTSLKADNAKYQQQISELQAKLKKQQDTSSAETAALQKKITDLTARETAAAEQNAALKSEKDKMNAELTAARQDIKAGGKAKKPETLRQQESYTAGIIFSDEIKNRIAENKKLGINIDPDLMLEGISDGYNGKAQLDDSKLKSISNNMDLKIKSALNKHKKAVYGELDKAIAGKKVISQANGVSIVLEKKGKTPYKKDSMIAFDTTEKTLSGKTIVNSYNNKIEDQSKLPPVLMKAITEAQKGGHITFYGLAGNVYTRERMPKDIPPDTPVKIDFILK